MPPPISKLRHRRNRRHVPSRSDIHRERDTLTTRRSSVQTIRPRPRGDHRIATDTRPDTEPLTLERLLIHRGTLRTHMIQRQPRTEARISRRKRIKVVRVRVILGRPLEVSEATRLLVHAPLAQIGEHLTIRHPRRRRVDRLRILSSRQSRHQRRQLSLLQRVRFIKNQRARRQATPRPLSPRQKPQRTPIIKDDAVLRVARVHRPHTLRQIRRTINPAAQPQERRLSRLQLVRRPNDVRLFKEEHSRQGARLQDDALALLSRDHHTHLGGRELPIQSLTQHAAHNVLLPRVQHQTHGLTQSHSVIAKVRIGRSRDQLNPRPLRASHAACS